jgi:cohesin loading factor subunit SCC2
VSDLSDEDEKDENRGQDSESNVNLLQLVERRRNFLLTKIRPFADPLLTSRKTEVVQTFVDYQSAELLTRYLASKRPFSVSFDFFLKRVIIIL